LFFIKQFAVTNYALRKKGGMTDQRISF